MPDLPVFRAPMRSRDDRVPAGDAVERALTRGICGMGARVERTREGDDAVRAYERLARRIARFAAAPSGAPIWTRDVDGFWWLGRLDGDLSEDTSPEARRVDLVHVRPCRWLMAPIAPSDVPVPVSAAFARGGLNWQEVHGADISGQTDRIWDRYDA